MIEKTTGLVKWYNATKGFGFITVDGRVSDVFFHAKQWGASALAGLPVEGETLTFTVTPGPKGDFATEITRPTNAIGKQETA